MKGEPPLAKLTLKTWIPFWSLNAEGRSPISIIPKYEVFCVHTTHCRIIFPSQIEGRVEGGEETPLSRLCKVRFWVAQRGTGHGGYGSAGVTRNTSSQK